VKKKLAQRDNMLWTSLKTAGRAPLLTQGRGEELPWCTGVVLGEGGAG